MTALEEKLRLRLQEEIIEQKERYGRLFQESSFKDGYYAAIKQLKQLVWHTKNEKPVAGNYILITDGNGFMCDDRVEKMSETQRWAYLSDLLPEIEYPEIPGSNASSSLKELLSERF